MINLASNINLDKVILINFINLAEKEKEMVREWRNNPDIKRWMYTDHAISQEEHCKFIENLKNDHKNYFWLVKSNTNECLGVIYFIKVDFNSKRAYFGIYANPDSKILGLGRLFDDTAKKIAFEILDLHTLKLEVIEDNAQVINLHKKMGFSQEGLLRDFAFKDNSWKNVVVMGMVNERV